MLNSWFAMTMLAIESNEVIGLRVARIAAGGAGAWDETELMISEKLSAGVEAATALLSGASALSVINRYRELVAANSERMRS